MTITTLSSREFQQNASQAQKAAEDGPVVITKRGKPAQVLVSFAEYERLRGSRRALLDALSMPGLSEIEFDAARLDGRPRAADFL